MALQEGGVTVWGGRVVHYTYTYTLHLMSYTLHPRPYTLHTKPYTLHPRPYTQSDPYT